MKGNHFSVQDWEKGEPVDEQHLRQCRQCARQWEMRRFLQFQIDNLPAPPEAPFFAARVARHAYAQAEPFWAPLERAARQLIPLFATATLAAIAALFLSLPAEEPDPLAQLLVGAEEPAQLSIDDVVASLEENGEKQ